MTARPSIVPRHHGHTGFGEVHTRFEASGASEELPQARFPPSIRSFLDYWLARRAHGAAAIDPLDIPHLLPHLMLWSVRPAGDRLDFVCRLAGGDVDRHGSMPIRGRTLEELNPHNAEPTRSEFELVARTGALHYVERTADWIERPFLYYCRLLMPLARPGEAIGDLVSVLTYDTP